MTTVSNETQLAASGICRCDCRRRERSSLLPAADAHEHATDEVAELLHSGIADRDRPTLINIRTAAVGA
jgi:hypothetical protein